MGRVVRALIVLATAALPWGAATAQATAPSPRPTLRAEWVAAAPTIDGRLDEPIWRTAAIASDFVQRTPRGGATASQRSEVRVAYDRYTIYVGVRNFDTAPDSVAQQLGRRDSDEIYSDWFSVGFDSYADRRTAFVFRVNPRGVLRDAYLSNDEEEDPLWDAVWNVAARIDSAGWTAEFAIPLSQLRYDLSGEQGAARAWGINFSRDIARHGETSTWAPTPVDAPGVVSRFGGLVGLDSLRAAPRLEMTPYARVQRDAQPVAVRNALIGAGQTRVAVGGDVRVKLPQSLTLTASINPDFGQVEADPAVVNLSAFEVFFSERRPFFLENADVFAFGSTRTWSANDSPTFFYTRRIGRPPQSVPEGPDIAGTRVAKQTPIWGALKLSGTTPGGWQVGSLNATTARATAEVLTVDGRITRQTAEPLTNYHVSRVRKLLRGGNAGVGAFVSDVRRPRADAAVSDAFPSSASVAGLDWESAWQSRRYTVSGVLAGSRTRGTPGALALLQRENYRSLQRPDAPHLRFDSTRTALAGHYLALSVAKTAGERVLGSVTYEEISAGFETNDVGYQFRADVRSLSSVITYRNPTQSRFAREYDLNLYHTLSDNLAGDRLEHRVSLIGSTVLPNFWSVSVSGTVSPTTLNDRLLRGGPLAQRPASHAFDVSVTSDDRRLLILSATAGHRRDASGQRAYTMEGSLDWRPVPQARVSLTPAYVQDATTDQYVQSVSDPQALPVFAGRRYVFAHVRQREARLDTRLDWTFSPWLSLQLFLQPFAASGAFSRFKEFTTPRRFAFAEYGAARGTVSVAANGDRLIDPDGMGPAAAWLIPVQNFTVHSLRGTAVLRWEFHPGSTWSFVWSQQREQSVDRAQDDIVAQARRALGDPGQHVFLVKFSRWIGR